MPLIYCLFAFILSLSLSFATRRVCCRYNFVDVAREARKTHKDPTPNLGGIAIFVTFWVIMFLFVILSPVTGSYLKYIIGMFLGSLLLFVIGIVDDQKSIGSGIKFGAQILSALIIITAGIGITFINNPFGGFILLDQIKIPLDLFGSIYNITLWADIFALIWIVGMINVINFLDGLDGLASGVSAIAFFVIYILSINPVINQPLSGIIALIALGAVLGFIPLNLNPAKIFMGDNGSMFLGFLLATLAIVAGSKVATALLVLGLPVFDGIWVATARIIKGKRPWTAGRDHLHHRLLNLGLSKRWVVIIFWAITALFGSISMIAGTWEKFVGLICLLAILIVGTIIINILGKKNRSKL